MLLRVNYKNLLRKTFTWTVWNVIQDLATSFVLDIEAAEYLWQTRYNGAITGRIVIEFEKRRCN